MSRMTRMKRTHGFSLLELIFGLAIMAIFLGMSVVSLRQSIHQEGPKALAYTLASDIKAARAEAKRSGKLVAFCLPSDGKTNRFAGNAVVRRGEQRGHIIRTLAYGKEYTGSIFSGAWPGSVAESYDLTFGWEDSTDEELAIFFRPDGTAFSPDIPSLDGNYPLLVGSRFQVGGSPLSAVENPHTVWVSQAGTITVDERMLPVGTLPVGGTHPTVASIDYLSEAPTESAPEIVDIKFLPEQTVGLDSVGMGQNYVNVHADQKESERLEYGIATLLIRANDRDGGPVYYRLEALASEGGGGKFSVSDRSGAMHYVYDEASRRYYWQALVSWRPPPAASEDTEYELQVTVFDEEGRSDTTASGAGLLPVISTLTPVRMVMAGQDGHLYLANLEGGSTIQLTDPGEREHDPFFSQDGSRVYSFYDASGGGQQFRVRNADGSRSYRVLRNFSANVSRTLKYDPSYQYVAYVDPGSDTTTDYPYRVPVVDTSRSNTNSGGGRDDSPPPPFYILGDGGPSSVPGQTLEVLHLMANDPPLTISRTMVPGNDFYWDARNRHTLVYSETNPMDEAPIPIPVPNSNTTTTLGPAIPSPGYLTNRKTARLVGYPPRLDNGIDPANTLRADNRSYNPASEDWFLYTEGSQLLLGNRGDDTIRDLVHDGNIIGKPSWSSSGTHATFIADLGGDREVLSMRLLTNSLTRTSPSTQYHYRSANVSQAQLDPDARWVFFLENGALFRAVNTDGASRVNLSEQLGTRLDSYVIAP